MNALEYKWCKDLMEKIKSKKIYKYVYGATAEAINCPSFEQIESNLDNHSYISVFDWCLDVELLIEELNDFYQSDRAKKLIVIDFGYWFEKKITNRAVTENEKADKKLNKLCQSVVDIALTYDGCSKKLSSDTGVSSANVGSTRKSSHTSSHKQISQNELNEIQKAIDEVKDSNVVISVLRVLRKWMPDEEITDETSIEFSKIPKPCLNEIRIILGQK